MDKSNLLLEAISPQEREREIALYIEYFTKQYGRYPSINDIASYLVLTFNTVQNELKRMEEKGFRWIDHRIAA